MICSPGTSWTTDGIFVFNSLWYIFLPSTCLQHSLEIVEESRCAVPKIHRVTFNKKNDTEQSVEPPSLNRFLLWYIYSSQGSQTWWKEMQQAVVWFSLSQLGHGWSCLLVKLSQIRVKEVIKTNLDKQDQELDKPWKSQTKGQCRSLVWGEDFRYQQDTTRPGNKCRQCRNKHDDDSTEDRTRCKNQRQMNRATCKRNY